MRGWVFNFEFGDRFGSDNMYGRERRKGDGRSCGVQVVFQGFRRRLGRAGLLIGGGCRARPTVDDGVQAAELEVRW